MLQQCEPSLATEQPIFIEEMVNLQRILDGTIHDVNESGIWAARLYMQRVPEDRLPLLATWAEAFETTVRNTMMARAQELARQERRTATEEAIRQNLERGLRNKELRPVDYTPRAVRERPQIAAIDLDSLLD